MPSERPQRSQQAARHQLTFSTPNVSTALAAYTMAIKFVQGCTQIATHHFYLAMNDLMRQAASENTKPTIIGPKIFDQKSPSTLNENEKFGQKVMESFLRRPW